MAHAQTLNCINKDYGRGGFIPGNSKISIVDGKYFYVDDFVSFLDGSKGILGKSKSTRNDRIYFEYDLQMPLRDGGEAKLQYKVSFSPKKRKILYSAIISGYDNSIRGDGSCR
jgi:hypothetical protein